MRMRRCTPLTGRRNRRVEAINRQRIQYYSQLLNSNDAMDDGWWIGVVGSVAMRCWGDGRSRCCERIADDFDEERERGGQRGGAKWGSRQGVRRESIQIQRRN